MAQQLDRAIAWNGTSQLTTNDPIAVTITGIKGKSRNPKTGPMAQAWILRSDVDPIAAVKAGTDTAICGGCMHRGAASLDYVAPVSKGKRLPMAPVVAAPACGFASGKRTCYVRVKNAPLAIFRRNVREGHTLTPLDRLRDSLRGKALRLGAYGDPAALPLAFWRSLLAVVRTWTGYTHQWRTCDQGFRAIVMASVESRAERDAAHAAGWRTFRVLGKTDAIDPAIEVLCPASKEAGKRTTCYRCGLCKGMASGAKSIAIFKH